MKRKRLEDLRGWLQSKNRKPLVLRGARQVGKTWLVRNLSKTASLELLELNFERNPEYVKLFSARSPQAIYDDITLQLNRNARPVKTLLFLDEIQSAPEVLAHLRWFSEEMPELGVVAAGSLLEFALADMQHSMPAVVDAAINGADAAECRQIQRDLIQTYRDDFSKYAGRIHPNILNAT